MTGKWRLLVYGAASLGQSILLCAPASAFNTSQHHDSSAQATAGAGEDAADIRKFGGTIRQWSGGLCALNPRQILCTPAEELAHTNNQRADFCTVADNGGPFKAIHDTIFPRYSKKSAGIEHGAGLLVKNLADLHPHPSAALTDQGTASDAGGQEPSTMTLREVFKAIDAAPSAEAAHQLFLRLATYQADSEADLIKAYGLAKKQQAAKGTEVEKARQRMAYAVSIITKATAAHQQEWVARLLSREAQTLPSGEPGLWGAESQQDRLEQSLRFGPAIALIEAAITSKNRSALPALRLIFDKGGMIGKHADLAINEIGDPEDLERAVAHIKKNPEDPISLAGFGDLIVPRFLKEIDDPSLPENLRIEFIGRLGQGARPGNCRPYLNLLKHKHPKVREIAAQNLVICLTKNDEALILRLLWDSDRDVQWQALSAIDEKIWHPKHVPALIAILESGLHDQNRAKAARILGRHGVVEAIPALQRGLQSKSSVVRRACRIALHDLGEDPR